MYYIIGIASIFFYSSVQSMDINKLSTQLRHLADSLTILQQSLNRLQSKKIEQYQFTYQTFKEWQTDCAELPYYRTIGLNYNYKAAHLTFEEVLIAITAFLNTIKKTDFSTSPAWVNNQAPSKEFLNKPTFKPFAQKLLLKKDAIVALHGDLHGDIHSLLAWIQSLQEKGYLEQNSFKIKNPNFYLLFLGDYVDRGNYGIEVIYTILRLKIANPNHVFMVRGNHEDRAINWEYGFTTELKTKFGEQNFDPIYEMYNILPAVLYLGSGISDTQADYLQCCHGGMEMGYLPTNLLNQSKKFEWIIALNRVSNFNTIATSAMWNTSTTQKIRELIEEDLSLDKEMKFENFVPTQPFEIGFIWNDFIVPTNPPQRANDLQYRHGRGWIFGESLTASVLKASKSVGVMRAHQHYDPMMKNILQSETPGVSKLWPSIQTRNKELWHNIVCTFNVAPDSSYGEHFNYNFDTYALLKTGNKYPDDWNLTVYRNDTIH